MCSDSARVDVALCINGGKVAVLLVVGTAPQIDRVAQLSGIFFPHDPYTFRDH